MKTSSIEPSRYGCSMGVFNALLAAVLTVLSLQYIEPKNCYRFCEALPCPTGGCRFGEQKAGWPLPVFVDYPGGGSPTSGWGRIGPEDPVLFMPLVLDIAFYSLIVWLAMWFVQLIRGKSFPVKDLLTSLLLNSLFAISLWIFSWMFGAPIGRGQSIQVYIDTPTDRGAVMAFFPSVSLPVEELIQTFGNPDEVWLTSERSMDTSLTRLVLHWNSIGMFAQLPAIAGHTYLIEETTQVKMIIFPYEEPVVAFDGKPLGEKSTSWTGYGNYQP